MKHVVERLSALDLGRTAAVLAGSVVVVGLVGVMTLWLDPENAWFDLDSELGLAWPPAETTLALPAIWSAILFAFGGLSWLAAGWRWTMGGVRLAALGLGTVLLFLALDELFIIHERLEARAGIDWPVLYLPLALLGATLALFLLWQFRDLDRRVSWLLAAGGACYAVATLLELSQWRGDEQVALYAVFMVPEELLELTGSSLLALAALVALRVEPKPQSNAGLSGLPRREP